MLGLLDGKKVSQLSRLPDHTSWVPQQVTVILHVCLLHILISRQLSWQSMAAAQIVSESDLGCVAGRVQLHCML
jgi:hypothetical protein